jgi:AraC-like DNA-binding protein
VSSSYLELPFDADLAPIVDAAWIKLPGADLSASDALQGKVLPDGCIDLIFRGSTQPGEAGVRLFTSALIDQAVDIGGDARYWHAGVRFRPGMSRAVLGLDPRECRGRDIAAAQIDGRFALLEQQLMACDTARQALAILHAEAGRRARQNRHALAPAHVRAAVTLLASPECGGIAGAARSLGLSERSLHRDLVGWTGLAPKLLARIFRMQRAMAQIRSGRLRLAAVALDAGYADQAHMTREFQSLAGTAPSLLRPAPG